MVVEWISSDVWLGQGSFQFTAEYQDHQATKVYINDGIQGMIRLWGTETANVEARKPFSICIASRFYNYSSSFPWPSTNVFWTLSEKDGKWKRIEEGCSQVWDSVLECQQRLMVVNLTVGCTLLALYLSNIGNTAWGTYCIRRLLGDYAAWLGSFWSSWYFSLPCFLRGWKLNDCHALARAESALKLRHWRFQSLFWPLSQQSSMQTFFRWTLLPVKA